MESALWVSTLVGFGAGSGGLIIGGCLGYVLRDIYFKLSGMLMSLAAGIIFGLVGFELIPESIEIGGLFYTMVGGIAGFALIKVVERWFHKIAFITGDPERSIFFRSGILLAIGIAIHNLPVGFAMGAGMANQPQIGLDMATTVLLHNFPEGLAMSVPLVIAGLRPGFIPLSATIVAVPAAVGSYSGFNLGTISPTTLSLLLGVAIGTILYVTWHEILGKVLHTRPLPHLSVYVVTGVLLTGLCL